jgi:N4-(beta-N-acetylglucosaminyl)-L-asparaginase
MKSEVRLADLSRRSFLASAALSSASLALKSKCEVQAAQMDHSQHGHSKPERPLVPRLPALICKVTATSGIDSAFKMLVEGSDTLDAALHVCKTQEDDPKDYSAGLGGLPNMQGEVQLDACCLHGPTRRSAAIASVAGIRNASALARVLMEQTDNALLVGSDAHAFALAHGFASEDLLTDRSRKTYALWKEIWTKPELLGSGIYNPLWPESVRKQHFMPDSQQALDSLVSRLEPIARQVGLGPEATWRATFDAVSPAAEPVYVSTIDRKGQLSSACTSSGMPWRMPGVSSDVAVVGAGCFVDPDVGSAGSSGNAAANIKIAGAHTIIENMRMGMSPEEAGLAALRRVVQWCNSDMTTLRFIEIVYYILRKDGAYGAVSLWRGDRTGHVRQFTISDGEGMRRTEDCRSLFQCSPTNGCPDIHSRA